MYFLFYLAPKGYPSRLVGVGQAAHAAHHAQHVVVHGVDTHLRSQGHGGHRRALQRVGGQRQVQHRIVNAGEVAGAAGLVLLGLEGERVHVDAQRGGAGVVLVGLHEVEVGAKAGVEAVVAVQLDLRHRGRVVHGVIRVVEGLVGGVVAVHVLVELGHPHKLLHGVVEGHLDVVLGRRHGLTARELELLDQVLVGHLGEAAALLRVQVDVVHVEGRRHKVGRIHAVAHSVHVGRQGRKVPHQVLQVVELQVDADLVVLERNQRQRQAGVAAEPELQGHIQRVLGGAAQQLARRVGLAARAVVVAVLATLHNQVGQLRHVAHHLRVAGLLARLLRELVPDVQPVAIVLVDALAANLQLHVVDQVVAHPVEPTELRARAVRRRELHGGQSRLEVDAVD